MSKTVGEKRVRVDFNVASQATTRSQIDVVKEKSAELINICEGLKKEGLPSEGKPLSCPCANSIRRGRHVGGESHYHT